MELALVLDNTGSMNGDALRHHAAGAPTISSTSSTARRPRSTTSGSASCPTSRRSTSATRRTGWLAAGDRVLTNLGSYSTARLEGLRHGAGLSLRRRRHADRVAEAHLVLLRRDRRSTSDNNWPTIKPNRIYSGDVNAPRGPNLGCGPAITPLTSVAADDRRRDRRHGRLGPRRHHRQPRAHLGLAHDLAALARRLGRRDAGRPCRSTTTRRSWRRWW